MSAPERPSRVVKKKTLFHKEENEELRERNTNLSYVIADLNTKVKEVENEKQSLVTAMKILHDDQVNEITNHSRSMAQVDHQSTSEHKTRRKSGRTYNDLFSQNNLMT